MKYLAALVLGLFLFPHTVFADTTVFGGGGGTGTLTGSGTPTNHQWPGWTSTTDLKGFSLTASKPVCTDASGDPAVCAGTEGVWVPYASAPGYTHPDSYPTALCATDATHVGACTTVTMTVFSGTATLGTGAISSPACATAVDVIAAGVATTDVVDWGFNGDPTGVTGYVPLTTGMLTIIAYPGTGHIYVKVCNNTSASITPGAITLNVKVRR